MKVYAENTGIEPSFLQWTKWAFPIVIIMLPIVGFWLTRSLTKIEPIELPDPGSWRPEEWRTLCVFGLTAAFWVFRKQPFGGWSEWLGVPGANDASVALIGATAMFLLPNGKGERLLDWESARKIPWGILVLFAGGICIAKAFISSGLSNELGKTLATTGQLPTLLLVAAVCLAVTFLTEVTSNTATTTLLMPILAAAAIAAKIDPLIVMVPATISASFAFMLPVATPPNAIVFGANRLTVRDMAREGLWLNLIGVIVVTAICYVTFGLNK